MPYNKNSYHVLLSYLADTDYCWQKYFKDLGKICPREIAYEIQRLCSEKNSLNTLNLKKPSIAVGGFGSDVTRKFRLKLISNKIFNHTLNEIPQSLNDLYELIICIERKTIDFFEEYFSSYTYYEVRDILNTIIEDKERRLAEVAPILE